MHLRGPWPRWATDPAAPAGLHGFSAWHPPGAAFTVPRFDEFMKRVQPAKPVGAFDVPLCNRQLATALDLHSGESGMKADAVVRARIDTATKERATAALGAMGLSVSDEQRLPFDVKVPTPATVRAMKELDAGKGSGSRPRRNSFPIWTSESAGTCSAGPFPQGCEAGQETGQGLHSENAGCMTGPTP